MAIYSLNEKTPVLGPDVWVADSAQVIGDVQLDEAANIWFGAVLRGDSAKIHVGARSNIQDLSVLHVDAGVALSVGCDVTVGHQVTLHGCTIGDGSLIGIQSVIMNRACIGRGCIVGAGSVVPEGKVFPDGALILGSPARVVRTLDADTVQALLQSARHYVDNAARYRLGLKKIA